MDDLISVVKKGLIAVAVVIGLLFFIKTQYSLDDALKYAKDHPHPINSPRIEYYVATTLYLRDRPKEAVVAYNQLLMARPTCQYAPKALFRKGTAHQGLRQWQKAREAYKIYMKYFPKGKDFSKVSTKFEVIKFEKGEEYTGDLFDLYNDLEHEANYGDSF